MFTNRRFRQIALTALLFAVILCLLFLLLAPHASHASNHVLPWLCITPFLLFAAADFRRTLPLSGSTLTGPPSPQRTQLSRLQLPPPAQRS